jgi:hypothetical protein
MDHEHSVPAAPEADGDPPPDGLAAAVDLPLAIEAGLDAWDRMRRRMSAHLRVDEPPPEWLPSFLALATEVRELAARDIDLALYVLISAAGDDVHQYSTLHALMCAVIADLAARWQGWPEEEVGALVRAALTMNVSMTQAHDMLAQQRAPLSEAQRRQLAGHAEDSAQWLRRVGVDDPLWLEAVRLHHDVSDEAEFDGLPPGQRLAEMLRRIDVYAAKLSRRLTRAATSPALAARDACLGPAGHPDSVGATLLRVLGLYPPGTCVALVNGETGVVIARGAKAHTPTVAALRRGDGGLLMQPQRRDTQLRPFVIRKGISALDLRVRLHHARTLSC